MLPGLGIAEELGDVDQQHLEQLLVLVGVDLEVVQVVAEGLRADGLHPAPEATLQARTLVAGEVQPATALEELQQRLEGRILGDAAHPATLHRPAGSRSRCAGSGG